MTKRLSALAAVLIVAGAVFAWWRWPQPAPADPKVEQARALQTKLAAGFGNTTKVEEQVKTMTELRDSMEKMNDDQRRKVIMGPGGPRELMRRDAEAFAE